MTDYQRRVRLTLTAAEADALNTAIEDTQSHSWEVPAAEKSALVRAHDKLNAARWLADRRNAEKAAAKAAKES